MEEGCKVVWLVGVRVHCKNCLALGWSKRLCLKLVGTLVGFGQQEDWKERAGDLVGRREEGFLAVAPVECRKLQQ